MAAPEPPGTASPKNIKVNGKYAEWKNGNIVITDALPKKEDENIIE